jgi:hypothetical protein
LLGMEADALEALALIQREDATLIEREENHGRVADERPQALLTGAQGVLHPHAGGDFAGYSEHTPLAILGDV